MKEENRKDDSNFEKRLLKELKAVVARRSAERESSGERVTPPSTWLRAPRLATVAVAVLAVVAAVLLLDSGGQRTPKAFAVEPQAGGGVAIKVFSPEDAAGLEMALGDAGIRSQVTWLPAGMTCRERHFTPSTAKTALGGSIGGGALGGPGQGITIGVMSAQQWRERQREYRNGEISEGEFHDSIPNISFDPTGFRPDQTVVISGSRGPYDGDPEGGFEVQLAIAEGTVEPCEPVEASEDGLLGGLNGFREAESSRDGPGR